MDTATIQTRTILALAILGFPITALAQVELPTPNTVTIGGDVGAFFIDGTEFRNNSTASGAAHIEYYYNPRVTLRGTFSYANPEYESDTARTLRQKRVLFNVLYYPLTGRSRTFDRFRPFATLGGGAYFMSQRLADRSVLSELLIQDLAPVYDSGGKAGANFGFGGEYWWRTFAVRTEFLVHVVGKADDGTSVNGVTWMFGIKVPVFRGKRNP